MATCVDLAGASYPKKFNGETITPMEGVSLRPALAGQPLGRSQPIFWEHEGNRAVRDGRWKLVSKFPGGWELYDITTDRTELHDLAAQQPERVRALVQSYDTWAKRAGVLPWPVNKNAKKNSG
jgi:arylsulfatase